MPCCHAPLIRPSVGFNQLSPNSTATVRASMCPVLTTVKMAEALMTSFVWSGKMLPSVQTGSYELWQVCRMFSMVSGVWNENLMWETFSLHCKALKWMELTEQKQFNHFLCLCFAIVLMCFLSIASHQWVYTWASSLVTWTRAQHFESVIKRLKLKVKNVLVTLVCLQPLCRL